MIDEDMTCTIPDPLYRRLTPDKRVELAGKIRQLYFKGGHVSEETVGSLVDVRLSNLRVLKSPNPSVLVFVVRFF